MQNLLDWLKGKKTYGVLVATILYAVGGFASGQLTGDQAVQVILAALTAAGFRSAMK